MTLWTEGMCHIGGEKPTRADPDSRAEAGGREEGDDALARARAEADAARAECVALADQVSSLSEALSAVQAELAQMATGITEASAPVDSTEIDALSADDTSGMITDGERNLRASPSA